MQNFTKNNGLIYWGILIIIFFLWILSLRTIDKLHTELNNKKTELNSLNQEFSVFKNKSNETIAKQEILITSDKKLIKDLLKEVDFNKSFKPKNATQVIKEKIVTEYDTVFVALEDTSSLDTNYVRVPNNFLYDTKFIYIKGKVLYNKILFEELRFPNTITTAIVKERYNLFYNRQVLYTHIDNPYSSIKEVKSVILKKEPNKFLKYSTKVLIFVGGVYLGSHL